MSHSRRDLAELGHALKLREAIVAGRCRHRRAILDAPEDHERTVPLLIIGVGHDLKTQTIGLFLGTAAVDQTSERLPFGKRAIQEFLDIRGTEAGKELRRPAVDRRRAEATLEGAIREPEMQGIVEISHSKRQILCQQMQPPITHRSIPHQFTLRDSHPAGCCSLH
ncbi:MAG: hypothetical protein WBL23_01775 [Salinisphaera sp.]